MVKNGKFKGSKKPQKSFNKNNKFKKNYNKKPNRYMMVKRQIEKNKESEENLKRQQLAELKYKKKQALDELQNSSDDEQQEQEINHFQELVSSLKKNQKRKPEEEAETSVSSESENEEEDGEQQQINDSDFEETASSQEDNESNIGSELEMSEQEEPKEEKDENGLDQTINTEFLDDSIVNDLNRDVVDEEQESDSDDEEKNQSTKAVNEDSSPFTNHLNFDLSPKLLENISGSTIKSETTSLHWSALGNIIVEIPKESKEPMVKKKKTTLLGDEEVYAKEGIVPKICDPHNLVSQTFIKQQIVQNIPEVNSEILETTDKTSIVTPLQNEILSIVSNYQDFYYPHRTHKTGEEIRLAYCIHSLNHVLKTRQKVLQHNAKLAKLKENKKNTVLTDEFRDQGFVRPRVLIILPFRDSAYRVINMLIDLLNPKEKSGILNYKRFVDEFTGQTLYFPKKNPKPEDYELTFAGNTEDTFRIGISLTKKSMKLYTPFYAADILIASPLGLRLIIGAPGEKDREYDFLASIELLILDQMELFLAQNWDHLLYLFDHIHLQPQSRQNTDFSRVRSWCLNGWSKFYRQTILISSYDLPEFRSLFNNRCKNYHGKVKTANKVEHGSIRHVVMEIPQVFHRIEVKSLESSFDTRFEYFTNTILPQFKSATMAHTMIYVPSYFDYVRIRNYLKKEEVNFTQICEYTKDNKISRARTLFYHGGARFLLYSERSHFFRRMRIKGIRHIIMYQPPMWSNFYPEMLNLMQEINQNPRDDVMKNSMTVTVLYTKYDILQLSAIVGHENVGKMLSSKRNTHMFVNNE
ncbi:hypothetical protein PVAND_002209 [Polypedilum vanderplanki]|uniref:Digestive organ expansion factor-like protein n=1 Tax=Polypedilum vanderplanki TaxID=319348 RepID=A0A9J6BQK4_POLVA|nr:hypothetical protein PVAND_002209 [Polypedilum vanderplanki]